MKKAKNILYGVILVVIGVIWLLDTFKVINFTLFFDGWWTLLIIVPCTIELFTGKEKTGNIICIIVGILLLLACQDIISFKTVGKLFIPLALIIVGIALVMRNIFSKKNTDLSVPKPLNRKSKKLFAFFSGQELNLNGEEFDGAEFNAVFGGIDCDLHGARITDNAYIEANCIFGGIDLIFPENVNVRVSSVSIFGGVDNNKTAFVGEDFPTVYVKANCIFGGIEII